MTWWRDSRFQLERQTENRVVCCVTLSRLCSQQSNTTKLTTTMVTIPKVISNKTVLTGYVLLHIIYE